MKEIAQAVIKYKMGLTSLHFYGSWHLSICRSLFGLSNFFATSLVFLKGTSCCVIRINFKWNWAVRSCYGKVLQVIGLHDVRCYLHVASWSLTPPNICFQGTKYEINREDVVKLHYTLWLRAQLWLELFARTVVDSYHECHKDRKVHYAIVTNRRSRVG